MLKACKECNLLTERSECPLCNNPVSKDWQGYLIIVDHKRSTIAERMNIRSNGRYALKVR
jgi:DNA-directed RNA polymerase subunit E"